MSDSVSVQVAVRVRPLVQSELSKGCQLCLDFVPSEPQVIVKGTDRTFTYNYVFGPNDDNEYFYKTAVKELISRVFKGYNVTILAYGQTGSGKTYSMGTCYDGRENIGVIPLAVNDIFQHMKKMEDWDFSVSVSFMELYQEQLFDLLSPSKPVVDIREDSRGIIIPGLTEVPVYNPEETTKCLIQGSAGRATGATAMNAQSSRSHAIFTITVKQWRKTDESDNMTSKFHLVDLAGSERPKKTKATGERFKEGVNINKGLLALGNVISCLGEEGSQKGFISYRDSRLTRLLQDSLGGNSLTLMIACVSPADYNLEETMSTLRYADRARRIRNKPVVNQDPTAALVAKLKQELQEAQLELMNSNRNVQCPEEHKHLETEIANLASKNRKLAEALHCAFAENTNLVERALLAEVARDRMKVKLCELQAEYGNAMENLNQTLDPSTCPAEFWEQLKHLRDLQEKIKDLQAEQKRSAEEILNHELSTGNDKVESSTAEGSDDFASKPLIAVDIDERQEAHTLQQVELNKELKELNRALALKEELAAQLTLNSNHILNFKTDYDSAVKELEAQVHSLLKEKEELLHSLKDFQNSTVPPKENEQHKLRSKRLMELEQKISCLNKKICEQNKMIRMKEQSENKIVQLNNEIISMKQTKVTLIRQMKSESERFRTWKLQRERELSKLRDQDRKRQNQLVRMERLHTKQQNVWKRKVEEAAAINKRLKDALALQKSAQERRGNMGSVVKVQAWLSQELEIMYSIMDAEKTLDHLMEDRGVLNEQMTVLKESLENGNILDEEKSEIEEEIRQHAENISARNAQIADLQQKILDSDQESKSKTRWDCIQSLPESKHALKYLFDTAIELKREKAYIESRIEELQMECSLKGNLINEQEKTIKEQIQVHEQELIRLEKEHEEKIAVLLKHLSEGGDATSFKEVFEQVFRRQERIEELEALVNKMAKKKKPRAAASLLNNSFEVEFNNSVDSEVEDNVVADPNWQKTPIFKRIKRYKGNMSSEDETFKAVKRTSDGKSKCSCKNGSCTSKRCGCCKGDSHCSNACKCNVAACRNREQNVNNVSESVNDENIPQNFKKLRNFSKDDLSF